jgi:hypothetical protein
MQEGVCAMLRSRRLEASRVIPIPGVPYELDARHLPFGMIFAQTRVVQPRFDEGDNEDDPEKPPQKPAPTWSEPETTTPDSNDPTNDEEIDWLQDD